MRNRVALILASIGILFSCLPGSDAQWEKTDRSNFFRTSIYCFAVSGTNLFAGTWREGVLLSTNNGKSWNAVNSGLPKNILIDDLIVCGTNLFAGTSRGVFLSTNNGKKWKKISSGLKYRTVICLAVSGSNLFAGTQHGIFLSTNNGGRWKAVNSGLPEDLYGNTYSVNNIVINGTNLFVGTGDPLESRGDIYLSTDCGKNWISPSPGLFDLIAVNNIIDTGSIPIIMDLFVIGPNLFIGSDMGVLLSTDDGKNWRWVNSGLPIERKFYRILFDVYKIEAIGENLFAGTEKGVYMSTNKGKSWTAINSGLPENTSVYSFAVSTEYLFAGTLKAGAWRLPLSDLSIEKR